MVKVGLLNRATASPLARPALAAIVLLVIASFPAASPGRAVEVPPPGDFVFQTSGPNAGLGVGDWYSSTNPGGGFGQHYLDIYVPCGWPSATPINVDLFSPEMNRVAGILVGNEEPRANYDSTEFELYGPNASVGPGTASPAAGTGIPGTETVYQPGLPLVGEAWVRFATVDPATCGHYVLRSAVLITDPLNVAGEGNDDNGWRVRVGSDDDRDATTAPPAGYDNADGVPGTNDEIVVGVAQATFEQDSSPTACLTLYQFVDPGLPSVALNNFDMDGSTSLTYYAPSDPTGIAGTLSNDSGWNPPTSPAHTGRTGDTIVSPAPGWWQIVTCIGRNNQFIQEGATGRDTFFSQPPTPTLSVSKDDGTSTAVAGSRLTYAITVSNTAAGATAGSALDVTVTDMLPALTTFVSCAIRAPATGTCTETAGVVTATLDGWLNAGTSALVDITVVVRPGATGTLTNNVDVGYEDGVGNPYESVSTPDVDNLPAPAPAPPMSPTPTPTPSMSASPTPTPTPTPTPSMSLSPTPSISPNPSPAIALPATDTDP